MKSLIPAGLVLVVCVVSTYGQFGLSDNMMEMALWSSIMNPSKGAGGKGAGAGAGQGQGFAKKGGLGALLGGGAAGSGGAAGRAGGAGLNPMLLFGGDMIRDLWRCNFSRQLYGRSSIGRMMYQRCRMNAYF